MWYSRYPLFFLKAKLRVSFVSTLQNRLITNSCEYETAIQSGHITKETIFFCYATVTTYLPLKILTLHLPSCKLQRMHTGNKWYSRHPFFLIAIQSHHIARETTLFCYAALTRYLPAFINSYTFYLPSCKLQKSHVGRAVQQVPFVLSKGLVTCIPYQHSIIACIVLHLQLLDIPEA